MCFNYMRERYAYKCACICNWLCGAPSRSPLWSCRGSFSPPVWVVLKGKDAEMIRLSRHAGTSDCFHCLNILITLQSSGSARREVNYSAEFALCWRRTAAMRQRMRCQPECHSWRFFSAKTGCANEQSCKLIDGVHFFLMETNYRGNF